MNEVVSIAEMLQGAWPSIQPALSSIFTILVTNLFLRSNTSKTEIEKLKQAKFSEVADKLLEGGHKTHLEYYKCRNFNKIAEKADEVLRNKTIEKDLFIIKLLYYENKENDFNVLFEEPKYLLNEVVAFLYAREDIRKEILEFVERTREERAK